MEHEANGTPNLIPTMLKALLERRQADIMLAAIFSWGEATAFERFEQPRTIGFLFHPAKLVATDCRIKMGFVVCLRHENVISIAGFLDGVGQMLTYPFIFG